MDSDCELLDTQQDIAVINAALQLSFSTENDVIEETERDIDYREIAKKALIKCSPGPSTSYTLSLNMAMDSILQKIQESLNVQLEDCRKKLALVQQQLKVIPTVDRTSSNYYICGTPYFKDKFMFPSPANADSSKIKTLNIMNCANFRRVSHWTRLHKKYLEKYILESLQNTTKKNLEFEIKKIRKNIVDIKAGPKANEHRHQLNLLLKTTEDSLKTLPTLSLHKLAPPLNSRDDIDWDDISCKENIGHNARECRSMWRQFLHPSNSKRAWTKAEECQLDELAREHNFQNWDTVAELLNTGRSAYQCFVYHCTRVNSKVHGQRWTAQEDEYLKSVINSCRIGDYIPWAKVSYYMENRTKEQIYNRWTHSLHHNRRGRFSKEEDAVMIAAIKEYGNNYEYISKLLPGRNIQQVRKRHHSLITTLPLTLWTLKEDHLLISLISESHLRYGQPCYKKISEKLGKTKNAVRMRYLTLQRWFLLNPRKTLESAPRRRVQRKQEAPIDLKTALHMLNTSKNYSQKQERSKGEPFTFSIGIDSKFVSYFRNKVDPPVVKNQFPKPPITNISHLKDILLLLKAKLCKSSIIAENVPIHVKDSALSLSNLSATIAAPPIREFRTYSRKSNTVKAEAIKSLENVNDSDSIWSNESDTTIYKFPYNLPPSYNSINAFKGVLLQKFDYKKIHIQKFERFSLEPFSHSTKLWMTRFEMLFTWPAYLSNITPNASLNMFEDKNMLHSSTDFHDINALIKNTNENINSVPCLLNGTSGTNAGPTNVLSSSIVEDSLILDLYGSDSDLNINMKGTNKRKRDDSPVQYKSSTYIKAKQASSSKQLTTPTHSPSNTIQHSS